MTGPRIINFEVKRTRPTGVWRFQWTNHPYQHGSVHQNKVEVFASYAGDMAKVLKPHNDDGTDDPMIELPNNLMIRSRYGETSPHDIRLSRSAAEHLLIALKEALDWDGQ